MAGCLSTEECKKILTNQEALKGSNKILQGDVSAIKNALLGDMYHPVGLVERVRIHEKKISKIERSSLVFAGISTILVTIAIFWRNITAIFVGG